MAASRVPDSVDTLIIGCGMAGLAAGIRLAMYERDVLIVERHNAPGGLNSFYFKDGIKYDVGLHAVTNFADPGKRAAPLTKLLRQLRIPREALELRPQIGSRIAFRGVDLRFDNDFALLEAEVERAFPCEIDGFRRLRTAVNAFDAFDLDQPPLSTREQLAGYIRDPLLIDMLLCPLMYYGSAREHDMDFDQFVTLWKAIYEEGFARPFGGVRVIIGALLERYRELGGRRRMRCGVRRIIVDGGRAVAVELDDGQRIAVRRILSTAGLAETAQLCGRGLCDVDPPPVGRLSFAETIHVMDKQPCDCGLDDTIVFFNESERFDYRASEDPVDLRSGVLCCPNNYAYGDDGCLESGWLRVTAIANHGYWSGLDEAAYVAAKAAWFDRIVASALRFVPAAERDTLLSSSRQTDMFTPRTIERFTGHLGGAVYGSPVKLRNGRTQVERLYLSGTDQGFLGIIGAMLSGISMANMHCLTEQP